jgi:excisionase family DNA binding protein
MNMEPRYTVKEVLEILRVSRTNLYAIIKRGEIKAVKLGGKTIFFESEINRFLESLKEK